MKFHPSNPFKVALLSFVLFSNISCNKDSDLLAQYVVEDPKNILLKDIVIFTFANQSIVIEPIDEKIYKEPEKVVITEVTPPDMGSVEVREDNTLVYTPQPDKTGTDKFDYTASVTNPDKSVSTQTGNVSIAVTSKAYFPLTGKNIFYVTPSGQSSNSGDSEATAWNITHAFKTAKAGDIVYIKAGDYGGPELLVSRSGTAESPIKFIGYTTDPGDLMSILGSTFKYGNVLDANKMPLLSGQTGQTAVTIRNNYIELENFQITKYGTGIHSSGQNVVLRNIIATELGNQSSYNAYDGKGIQIFGNNTLLENSFVLNATAEAIKLYGSNNSHVNYCEVRADNPGNPTDYYFLLTGGTNNTIIENSYAERALNLKHGGHGFDMKDLAEYNVIRNCVSKNTNFELNFAGVRYNTIENCSIYGAGKSPEQWHARMVIFNGANNNLIKDMYIQDTWAAISWEEYKDGYIGPGGNRREENCGYDNTFYGIKVVNTNRILNVGGGTNYKATAKRNTFINCDFSGFQTVAVTYYPTEDIKFENSKFSNGKSLYTEAGGAYARYSKFNVTFENCTWVNNSFKAPK